MNENGLSAADIAAVTDKNNGFGYAYPVFPYGGGYGGGFGGGFGNDGGWLWIILILALFGRIQRKRKWFRKRI